MGYYRSGDILARYLRERDHALNPKPAISDIDPLTLSTLQQAALLQMHESPVKRAVINKLCEDAQARPSFADYAALVELGLCERNAGKRFHDLTSAGRIAVNTLEKKLCGKFSIHVLMERGRANGFTARFFCPCGWSVEVRNSTTAPGNAHAQYQTHLRTVRRLKDLTDVLVPMRAEG